jgi:phosphate transport system substrate-binding protein
MKITVVRRADASGTSFIFTNYLSKISTEVGGESRRRVLGAVAVGMGGQKNPGVCKQRRQNPRQHRLHGNTPTRLKRKSATTSSKTAKASMSNPRSRLFASAANADWKKAPGYFMVLTDQAGADSWPITGVT